VKPFTELLADRVERLTTNVCLGLDPRPGASAYTHPARFGGDQEAVAQAVAEHLGALLEASHDLIACCKPQSAFFEALGPPGSAALAQVMARARGLGVPILLDAKRGDIGSTAAAYAEAYLGDGPLAADALTLNPFLGFDTLEPFIDLAVANGRGLFVLLRTSNPGSADLQGLELASGQPLYRRLAERLAQRAAALPRDRAGYSLLGAVVGASHSRELAELREMLPGSWFLLPGYGAQGGTAASSLPALAADGLGAIVSASRSLTYGPSATAAAASSSAASWSTTVTTTGSLDLQALAAATRSRVETMRSELAAARGTLGD